MKIGGSPKWSHIVTITRTCADSGTYIKSDCYIIMTNWMLPFATQRKLVYEGLKNRFQGFAGLVMVYEIIKWIF